jgi:hypothetical protein
MELDNYLVIAAGSVSAEALRHACNSIYTSGQAPGWSDLDPLGPDADPALEKWLNKIRAGKLSHALSTGRTNSQKGMMTCGLLAALDVKKPKAARSRYVLVWAILNSAKGQLATGKVPEIDAEWERQKERFVYVMDLIPDRADPTKTLSIPEKRPGEVFNVVILTEAQKRFVTGARVKHLIFGEGEILNVNSRTHEHLLLSLVAEIQFDDGKKRTIEVSTTVEEKIRVL